MRIIPIFAPRLFSFHYPKQPLNAFDTILENWSDMNYLNKFVIAHKAYFPNNTSVASLVQTIADDARELDDTIFTLANNNQLTLDHFFKPFHNSEYRFVELSLQKGRLNYLRVYAIKIDNNCFVVTGGAIKPVRAVQHLPETMAELVQLNACKTYLQKSGVFDVDSFNDLQND